jgi:hypothetical protein
MSAITFSPDSRFCLFADRFGDVLTIQSRARGQPHAPDIAGVATATTTAAAGSSVDKSGEAGTESSSVNASGADAGAVDEVDTRGAMPAVATESEAAAGSNGQQQQEGANAQQQQGNPGQGLTRKQRKALDEQAALAAKQQPKAWHWQEATLVLGHLSSIITSLAVVELPALGSMVVSSDRDGKVRVSVLPSDPRKVSVEVAWCLSCAGTSPHPVMGRGVTTGD